MRAKFVLCSHEFSTKFRTIFRDLSSKIRRTLEELSRGQSKSRKRCSFHHVQRHNAMFTSNRESNGRLFVVNFTMHSNFRAAFRRQGQNFARHNNSNFENSPKICSSFATFEISPFFAIFRRISLSLLLHSTVLIAIHWHLAI